MDDADRYEQDRAFLEKFRPVPTEEAKATGYCLNCGEPLEKGKRWCDKDCRDDWEKEKKLKERLKRGF